MQNDKIQSIKAMLGTPYYENEYGAIYNIDCLEALAKITDESIDATITSPPYNIGKSYEEVMPIDNYVSWLTSIFNQVYRVSKSSANFILNLGYLNVPQKGRAVPIPYLLWDKTPFYLNQEIIWNYGAGVSAKRYLSPRNEKILWYVKDQDDYTFNLDSIRDPDVKYPNQKKNGKLRCNTLGKNPSDVWQIAKVTSGANRSSEERTTHPAQFPEDLIKRAVLGFTNEEDLILEPFLGSGTVGAVAMELNRKFIGFEINKEYCEVAKRRLESKKKELNSKKLQTELIF
ncbi:MAG: site-specific DNA-methyltransferase [Paludibacteraceae bacterium]|nr:site-specific DNA-methyltransferase [Paludibacteraceae bacterium]